MDNLNPTPRVITFSGPKEGVGKTSVCLNLALAWANYQKRNVLIIPLDPMCRHRLTRSGRRKKDTRAPISALYILSPG